MQEILQNIRVETIEKILASYSTLYSLSPADQAITKKNLESMSDEWLWREIALIEAFQQKMKIVTEKAAIEGLKDQEQVEKAQYQMSNEALFF